MLQEQLELLGLTRHVIAARCEIDMTVKEETYWETGQDVTSWAFAFRLDSHLDVSVMVDQHRQRDGDSCDRPLCFFNLYTWELPVSADMNTLY